MEELLMEELLMEELLMHKSPLISYSLNNSCAFNVNDYFNEIVHLDYGLDYISETITLFAILTVSFTFSILFVSNYVYKTMIDDFVEKYNSNKSLYEYDAYFYKLLDEYDSKEKNDLSCAYLNSLGNKYIKEVTPCGVVIITYNAENNSFDYYCKKSNTLSFNYLEVVSRIYVVNYDCKSIYNDNYDNLMLYYNIKYGSTRNDDYLKTSDSDHDSNNVEKSSNVFFSKKVTSSKNTELYNFVSNKYKYKGTLDDFTNYCKSNSLTICNQDICGCFFSLEKTLSLSSPSSLPSSLPLNNANPGFNNVISFKTFKTFNKTL
jgi:hypothetical protein